jgi:hypothetical protein
MARRTPLPLVLVVLAVAGTASADGGITAASAAEPFAESLLEAPAAPAASWSPRIDPLALPLALLEQWTRTTETGADDALLSTLRNGGSGCRVLTTYVDPGHPNPFQFVFLDPDGCIGRCVFGLLKCLSDRVPPSSASRPDDDGDFLHYSSG